jgi:hypothetical protein
VSKAYWTLLVLLCLFASSAFAQPFEVDWESFDCPGFEEAKYEQYLSYETFCYRVEVTCPEGVGGHFDVTLVSDGGVGFGGGGGNPTTGACGMNGGHFINSKFSHTCEFNDGAELELEVKAVGTNHCENEE